MRALVPGAIAVGLVAPAAVAHANPSLDQIQQQIQQKSAALEKVVEQYDKVDTLLKANQQKAATITSQLPPLQAKVDAAYANIGALAAEEYKTGGISAFNVMLDAGSTDTLIDQLGMLDQVARSRSDEIQAYTTASGALNAQKQALNGVLAQETAQRQTLANQKKTIQAGLSKLYAMRTQAYGAAVQVSSSSSSTVSAPYVAGQAGAAVRYAYGALGAPYTWAAAGPYSVGYDCSGLTMAAWAAAGVSLPHNAAMQWDSVTHISRSQLQPGDLVFYESLGHVAIYVGNGQVIHAPTFGEVVQLASVDMMPPYGYGRP